MKCLVGMEWPLCPQTYRAVYKFKVVIMKERETMRPHHNRPAEELHSADSCWQSDLSLEVWLQGGCHCSGDSSSLCICRQHKLDSVNHRKIKKRTWK